jgi:hypothetical protein
VKENKAAIIFWGLLFTLLMGYSKCVQAEDDWERILNLRGDWNFSIGDSKKWSDPKYIDQGWEEIEVPSNWEDEGFNGYNGYAWYRKTFDGTDLENKNWNYNLFLGEIDDVDEVYLNGHKIGFSGSFPPNYRTAYSTFRNYSIPLEYLNFNGKNLIAVRVYDSEGSGGIVSGDIGIFTNENERDLTVNLRGIWDFTIEERVFGHSDGKEFLANEKKVPPADAKWSKISVPSEWEHQGYNNFNGTAWYRKQFTIPKNLEGEDLVLMLGKIDDFDHAYINGTWIGSSNWHDKLRVYMVSADLFNAGSPNILWVYVDDIDQRGGIYEGPIGIMKQTDFTRYYRMRNR